MFQDLTCIPTCSNISLMLMFASNNLYLIIFPLLLKGGPFFEIFTLQGKDILNNWKSTGSIKKVNAVIT